MRKLGTRVWFKYLWKKGMWIEWVKQLIKCLLKREESKIATSTDCASKSNEFVRWLFRWWKLRLEVNLFVCSQCGKKFWKKKWKFFCGDVELMEFSIKKSTATKVGWDERGYCCFGSVWAKRWEMIVYYKCNSVIIVLSYKYF